MNSSQQDCICISCWCMHGAYGRKRSLFWYQSPRLWFPVQTLTCWHI